MSPDRYELSIYAGQTFLGTVIRSGPGHVYAYDPAGLPLGQFADLDAAALALKARAAP